MQRLLHAYLRYRADFGLVCPYHRAAQVEEDHSASFELCGTWTYSLHAHLAAAQTVIAINPSINHIISGMLSV
jgi:hypothetical protein